MKNHQVNSPLLIIAFNRPIMVKKLLDSLDTGVIKNRKIYVAIDGPRIDKQSDSAKIKQVVESFQVFEKKHKLSVHYLLAKKNLGCKIGVTSAINHVLKIDDRVIILEDDCMPSTSFLPYCDELLERYKNDENIMMINGTTFAENQCKGSHRLSKCAFVWGWATWRRAWSSYDVHMSDYETAGTQVQQKIHDYYGKYGQSLQKIIETVYTQKIDTWDAQWVYALWKRADFLTIMPNVNLISNIGFGIQSTHTKIKSPLENRKTRQLQLPLEETLLLSNTQKLDQEQYKQIASMLSPLSIIRHWMTVLIGKN